MDTDIDWHDIHAIWEKLAEFPASKTQQALEFLMQEILRLTQAQGIYWLASIRLTDACPDDPYLGWRPRVVAYPPGHEARRTAARQYQKHIHKGMLDESVMAQARLTGKFRTLFLRDLVSPQWFESPLYQALYVDRNITDTFFVATPVNDRCEAYLGIQRIGQPDNPFSQQDADRAAALLRNLTWFQRKVFLSHGLLMGEDGLTDAERRVLNLLLTERTEKQIAEELGLTQASAHTYVRQVYRKLGVSSRAGITALWLGQ